MGKKQGFHGNIKKGHRKWERKVLKRAWCDFFFLFLTDASVSASKEERWEGLGLGLNGHYNRNAAVWTRRWRQKQKKNILLVILSHPPSESLQNLRMRFFTKESALPPTAHLTSPHLAEHIRKEAKMLLHVSWFLSLLELKIIALWNKKKMLLPYLLLGRHSKCRTEVQHFSLFVTKHER